MEAQYLPLKGHMISSPFKTIRFNFWGESRMILIMCEKQSSSRFIHIFESNDQIRSKETRYPYKNKNA